MKKKTTLEDLKAGLAACEAIGKPPVKPARVSRSVSEAEYTKNPENYVTICGDTLALRCKAKSKRTGKRCRQAASKMNTTCKYHGGASTGPRTEAGRKRCADARTIHGEETRELRRLHSQKVAEFRILERVMRENNYFRLGR